MQSRRVLDAEILIIYMNLDTTFQRHQSCNPKAIDHTPVTID